MTNNLTDHQKKLLNFDRRPVQSSMVNLPKSRLHARRAIEDRNDMKRIEREVNTLA